MHMIKQSAVEQERQSASPRSSHSHSPNRKRKQWKAPKQPTPVKVHEHADVNIIVHINRGAVSPAPSKDTQPWQSSEGHDGGAADAECVCFGLAGLDACLRAQPTIAHATP